MKNVSDMKEKNGKTWKENNLAKTHKYPIDSLVEVKYDTWFGGGACTKVHARLFVFSHNRDCDGTPLYSLSQRRYSTINKGFRRGLPNTHEELAKSIIDQVVVNGMSEDSMTLIEVTEGVEYGEGALEWEEEDV